LYASVKADADAALATPSSAHVNVIAAWHAARARANAGLGNAADALADITQATTLVPESKDQFEGPYWSSERARVYAVTGDTESAIALLGDLVGKPASFVTPVTLRLDPIWMPLRGNARFEVLSSNR
jgi:hypothetical protein